jgi:hypothetical protein
MATILAFLRLLGVHVHTDLDGGGFPPTNLDGGGFPPKP